MADSVVTATGVHASPGPNGAVPLRREIRDLQANFQDQWNLYLLGLADLQKQPPTNILSYYNLAGIHGEPYVPWNGVNGDENANFGGYCTHSSVLFLTWHRPYLAVYEQALYTSVQNVASQFPDPLKAKYVAAAKDFRMPYWDWAIKISGQTSAFPTAISSPTATVVDVDGKTKQVNNPLYSFHFDDKEIPQELSLDRSWTQFPDTKRAPSRSGSSQNELVSRVITNEAASLRTNVSLVLLSYKQFDAFSNNAWLRSGTPGRYGSIEDLHNEIHDKVGQGGHMGSLEVSAFDPVFWLHHTNVDRLWAIWQAMNPNAYVINKVAQAQEANFTIAAGEPISANTGLKPFYDASGTKFWNSTGVKWTDSFGHVYPETQKWLYPNDQTYQSAVRNQVTRLYGGNVINNFFENIASIPAVAKASVPQPSAQPPAPAPAPPAAVPAATPAAATTDISVTSNSAPATNGSTQERKHTLNAAFVKHAVVHPVETVKEAFGHHHHANGSAAQTQPNGHAPAPSASHTESAPAPQAAPAQVPAPAPAPDLQANPAQAPLNPSTPAPLNVPEQFAHLVPNRTYTEWITNLRAVKHGLSQTFRVYVFLGDFNEDASTWPTEYNVVGRFTILGRGPSSPCTKCTTDRSEDLIVTGTVPLTSALLQDIVEGRLASLDPADVEPYLEKNLHWRVTVFDGSERNRDEVPGLKVSVVSTKVSIGEDGVPIYSEDYVEHRDITDGRPAGLGHGDEV